MNVYLFMEDCAGEVIIRGVYKTKKTCINAMIDHVLSYVTVPKFTVDADAGTVTIESEAAHSLYYVEEQELRG